MNEKLDCESQLMAAGKPLGEMSKEELFVRITDLLRINKELTQDHDLLVQENAVLNKKVTDLTEENIQLKFAASGGHIVSISITEAILKKEIAPLNLCLTEPAVSRNQIYTQVITSAKELVHGYMNQLSQNKELRSRLYGHASKSESMHTGIWEQEPERPVAGAQGSGAANALSEATGETTSAQQTEHGGVASPATGVEAAQTDRPSPQAGEPATDADATANKTPSGTGDGVTQEAAGTSGDAAAESSGKAHNDSGKDASQSGGKAGDRSSDSAVAALLKKVEATDLNTMSEEELRKVSQELVEVTLAGEDRTEADKKNLELMYDSMIDVLLNRNFDKFCLLSQVRESQKADVQAIQEVPSKADRAAELFRRLKIVKKQIREIDKIVGGQDKKTRTSPGRQVNNHDNIPDSRNGETEESSDMTDEEIIAAMNKCVPGLVNPECIDPETGKKYDKHQFIWMTDLEEEMVSAVSSVFDMINKDKTLSSVRICERCGQAIFPPPDPNKLKLSPKGTLGASLVILLMGMYSLNMPVHRLAKYVSERLSLGHSTIEYNMNQFCDIAVAPMYDEILRYAQMALHYGVVDGTPLTSKELRQQGNSNSHLQLIEQDPSKLGDYYNVYQQPAEEQTGSEQMNSEQTGFEQEMGLYGAPTGDTSSGAADGDFISPEIISVDDIAALGDELAAAEETGGDAGDAVCGAGASGLVADAVTIVAADNAGSGFVTSAGEGANTGAVMAGGVVSTMSGAVFERKPGNGYALSLTTPDYESVQIVLFFATTSRSKESIQKLLAPFSFEGVIHDGYAGYHEFDLQCGCDSNVQICLIHFRRRIYEVLKKAELGKELAKMSRTQRADYLAGLLGKLPVLCGQAASTDSSSPGVILQDTGSEYLAVLLILMHLLSNIYRVEGMADVHAPDYLEKIKGLREQYSRHLWSHVEFFMDMLVRLVTVPDGKGGLKVIQTHPAKEVVSFWLSYSDKLGAFLAEPRLKPDSMDVERAIRPLAVLRKNISSFTSEKGRLNYLKYLSLCETLRKNGVDDINGLMVRAFRDFVVYARHERLTAMYPKFMEDPKYFDKKNVMYQQNYADYSPGFDWKRYLPWNFTDELRDSFVSKDFLKRRSESQNGRFAKSLRQLG